MTREELKGALVVAARLFKSPGRTYGGERDIYRSAAAEALRKPEEEVLDAEIDEVSAAAQITFTSFPKQQLTVVNYQQVRAMLRENDVLVPSDTATLLTVRFEGGQPFQLVVVDERGHQEFERMIQLHFERQIASLENPILP